jgi:hypothetical protein
MSRRLGALALAASITLAATAGARAADVTAARLRTLAAQAAGGGAPALAELRAVTSVGGQPVQLAAALQTANAGELRARLRTLAAAAPGNTAGVSPAAARRTATAILGANRYSRSAVPDPLTSVFDKLGRALATLAAGSPGGSVVFWGVLAALVLGLATIGARRTLRRLEPPERVQTMARTGCSEDAGELERDAQAAEKRGAFDAAVRLRFRAGLLGLSSRKAIEYRPSLLTAEVARRLRSAQFAALAATFERVAYGGVAATAPDAVESREGWKRVLAQASSDK